MNYYPWMTLSDDESDDMEKMEIKSDPMQDCCSSQPPCVEEEDWESELIQLNNVTPYGPEDLIREDPHLKMPFYVPDHKLSEVKYNPSIHHVPPVRCIPAQKEALEGDQFEDAEE